MRSFCYATVLTSLFILLSLNNSFAAWDLGGKDKIEELANKISELNDEINRLNDTVEDKNDLIDDLNQKIIDYEKMSASQNEKYNESLSEAEKLRNDIAAQDISLGECKQKLDNELQRSSGIRIILFDGDIIYVVSTDAYNDYKSAIRFKSVSDPDFAKSLTSFEAGKGEDVNVLRVLKEIDTSSDRLIDRQEAEQFLKNVENL